MMLEFHFDNRSGCQAPSAEQFQSWAQLALESLDQPTELSLRLVDETEMAELNNNFRQKNQPTNVLSFPGDMSAETLKHTGFQLLGDLAICAPVVIQEAAEQHKLPNSHYAHLCIHGVLHLLGYDHLQDSDAEIMEAREIELMEQIGHPNPYRLTPAAAG